MMEIGVLKYKSLQDYGGSVPKKRVGSKPLLLFCGDLWTNDGTYQKLQNFLIDFYRGDPVDKLVASGLDHLITFTVAEQPGDKPPLIHQRSYFLKLRKNPDGSKVPLPYLTSCGPDMDFEVRRTQFAQSDLWKAALKQPAGSKARKVKNQSTNLFGETIGRLHLEKQSIDKMQGRKSKALRRAEKLEKEEETAELESELQREQDESRMEFKQVYGFDEEETERKSRFAKK
jgi:ribosome production factor 2